MSLVTTAVDQVARAERGGRRPRTSCGSRTRDASRRRLGAQPRLRLAGGGRYHGRERISGCSSGSSRAGSTCARTATEIARSSPARYLVRGELHSKHRPRRTRSSTSYEQRMEIRDGLLTDGAHVDRRATSAWLSRGNVAAVRRFVDAFNRRDDLGGAAETRSRHRARRVAGGARRPDLPRPGRGA